MILTLAIFERLRNILHESEIDKRVQYMIEVMFAVRKDGFKDHPVILEGLDLVEEDDQFTHMLPLEDDYNPEDVLSESGVGGDLGRGTPTNVSIENKHYFLISFFKMFSRWILISWRMKRSTKLLRKVGRIL